MTLERAKELSAKYSWFKAPRVIISAEERAQDPMLDIQFTFFPKPEILRSEAACEDFHHSFIIENFLSRRELHIISEENIPQGDLSKAIGESDDDDLVTEELAEIYLAQGLKTEARKIYRKLSLLYPEKSVYFAKLIAKSKT